MVFGPTPQGIVRTEQPTLFRVQLQTWPQTLTSPKVLPLVTRVPHLGLGLPFLGKALVEWANSPRPKEVIFPLTTPLPVHGLVEGKTWQRRMPLQPTVQQFVLTQIFTSESTLLPRLGADRAVTIQKLSPQNPNTWNRDTGHPLETILLTPKTIATQTPGPPTLVPSLALGLPTPLQLITAPPFTL